jgi:hypothetical protein
MLTDHTMTSAQEQFLRKQSVTADGPGTVLRDFQMLLDFLRPDGVEAAGKDNLLPIKFIGELDERLVRPLHLKLKRPQIRSHPSLQGLNLLLRATGLSRVEGAGSKAPLILDPQMLAQWDDLNATERYFNLLEAWLRVARPEMVGEERTVIGRFYLPCLQAWQSVGTEIGRFTLRDPQYVYVPGIDRSFYLLALMELFGLVQVKQPPATVTSWVPAGISRTEFGDAVFSLLYSRIGFGFRDRFLDIERDDQYEQGEEDEEGAEGTAEDEYEPEEKLPRDRRMAGVVSAVFPGMAAEFGAAEVGTDGRHVRLPSVMGQSLAADRHSVRWHSG